MITGHIINSSFSRTSSTTLPAISRHYPKRTMINFRDRSIQMVSPVLARLDTSTIPREALQFLAYIPEAFCTRKQLPYLHGVAERRSTFITLRWFGVQLQQSLICTDQPYVFTEIGVLPSLDPYSKHNIIHGSLNFHNLCPPPYKRKVWDYRNAKIDLIRNDLLTTDWKSLFSVLNTDEMSLVFTDTLLSIFSRYISKKMITCNDKDAPWITPVFKSAIRRNSRVYRKRVTY